MPVCRLHSSQDLDALSAKIGLFERPAAFRVELRCPTSLDAPRRQKLEKRLAFALSDCGCMLASLAMVVGILTMIFVLDYPFLPVWPNTIGFIASVITLAITAKLIGLFLSYQLAKNIIREIREALVRGGQASEQYPPPVVTQ